MKNITIIPEFKSDNDRLIMITVFVTSMFLAFIPSIIAVLFAKDYISESSYRITKSIFNFELLLFLISLIFLVPIIGWLLAPFLAPVIIIWNIIVLLLGLCAAAKNSEVKIPVLYEFL